MTLPLASESLAEWFDTGKGSGHDEDGKALARVNVKRDIPKTAMAYSSKGPLWSAPSSNDVTQAGRCR